jgi:hypothetical protein
MFKGPGRSYAPIHDRSSPPVNSVLVVAATGARPPVVRNWPGLIMIRILPPRSSPLSRNRYGSQANCQSPPRNAHLAIALNRSADVQQAPSSIHEGGKASSTGPERGRWESRLQTPAARPAMDGRHRSCLSDARTIKHAHPRADLGRCRG